MENFEQRLQNTFDSVHAEESLKESAGAYVRQKMKKRNCGGFYRRFQPAAALLCMLVIFLGGYFTRMYLEPVYVISIDINPSIELGVNALEHVVSVDAFNEDGRKLTEQLQLRFLNYEDAVERIVTSETVTALMENEEELVIAVVGEDANRTAMLCSSLENYTATKENTHCYTAPMESVKDAHNCGMSYGKYLACQQVLEQDTQVDVQDIQDMTMKEIREMAEETCHTEPEQTQTEPHHGHNGKRHQNGHH